MNWHEILTVVVFITLLVTTLGMAAWSFFRNQGLRTRIDTALRRAGTETGKTLLIPERRLRYDSTDIDCLKAVLSADHVGGGATALKLYVKPTLLWNDVVFAASLGLFTALFWFWVYSVVTPDPLLSRLAEFFSAMGLLYGLADVAEDLWLAQLLSQSSPVSRSEAMLAQSLTQLKFLTIVLSLMGALIFAVFTTIANRFPTHT
jgi:hypothetical protein